MKTPPDQPGNGRGLPDSTRCCRPAARLMSIISPLLIVSSGGATITFIGGNTTWTDGLNPANFSPADEPDSDDDVIFNLSNTVTLGSSNVIASLAMSNGISIDTAGFDLTVDGLFQLTGAGTDIVISGSGSVVSADDVSISSSAVIELDGGTLSIADESGSGLLGINAGGIIRGQGTITLADNALGASTVLLSNNGTINAIAPGLVIGSPPAGTLTINAVDAANARLNLDGVSPESGALIVSRNQTLDINVALADGLNGTIDLAHNSTLDIASGWTLSGGTLDADNGFVNVGNPIFNVPASTSFIAGGAFLQSGGVINVIDTDGRLQFNAPFTQTGGELNNFGEVVFNANATIGEPDDYVTDFDMASATARLTINPGVEVNIDQPVFDSGGASNVITIGSGGILDIDLTTVPELAVFRHFDNIFNLNGGELDVTSIGDWSILGVMNVGASTGTSQINGERVIFNGAHSTVGASSVLRVNATSNWMAGTTLSVGSGATVELSSPVFVDPGSINGAGTLRVNFSSHVTGNTTLATDTVDWDGTGTGSLCTIADSATLAINTTTFDSDGDMDDNVDLGGDGASLSVSGPSQWVFNRILNANTAVAGTATIGGTSRMVLSGTTGFLNVKGNSTVTAPLTYGVSSTTTIDPGATLTVNGNSIYNGGLIAGGGSFLPPSGANNLVEANTTISTSLCDFDRGSWHIAPGATLTLNVADYDNTAPNLFDNSITLESGTVSANTGDPEFVHNTGTLSFHNSTGTAPTWDGEPLFIGSDTGNLDANLNVIGSGDSRIDTSVTFRSDADVNIAAGCRLVLGANATFDTVNGAASARFTGAGELAINGAGFFNEATVLGMSGGTVDLDGTDVLGSTITVTAPLEIHANTLRSFGKSNIIGTNVLTIDNLTADGRLTVELDTYGQPWTMNQSAVMNLTNGPLNDVLLSGWDVVLNGTVNVTGEVTSEAGVTLGGTLNIGTAGEPFRLGSERHFSNHNILAGGTIQGPGPLATAEFADLRGSGTIHADIAFDESSSLIADDGTLLVTGAILSAGSVGTGDVDGVFHRPQNWDNGSAGGVSMNGGRLIGGDLTNSGGIHGWGKVEARVINESMISASGGETLLVDTDGDDNDWDGLGNAGQLRALSGATLEMVSHPLLSGSFNGKVFANGGVIFANGFALSTTSASTLFLNAGTFKHSGHIPCNLKGTILVGAGNSKLLVEGGTGEFRLFPSCVTSLQGNLHLDCPNTVVNAGATFSGTGHLVNLAGRRLAADNQAVINAFIENHGDFSPGGPAGPVSVARNDLLDYVQGATGNLEVNLNGATVGNFDRVLVGGSAQIAGDIEPLLGENYVPAANDTMVILSATGGVSGTFSRLIQPATMPPNLTFELIYTATTVQLKVVTSNKFDAWINSFAALTDPAARARTANPDGDALDNLGEFALDGDPSSGAASGKLFGKIAPVGGTGAMTLTLAVRNDAVPDPADPSGGELALKQAADGLTYRIQGSDNLANFTLDVSEVTGPEATAIQAGLPGVNPGWTYRTFRSPGPVTGDAADFMRVVISE